MITLTFVSQITLSITQPRLCRLTLSGSIVLIMADEKPVF